MLIIYSKNDNTEKLDKEWEDNGGYIPRYRPDILGEYHRLTYKFICNWKKNL